MTTHIKFDSDRPEFFTIIRDVNGNRVDLENADNVQFVMFDPEGVEAVNDSARVEAGHLGEVEYDLSASQVRAPGQNHVEIRVDWPNGDEQWFPIAERSYPLEVVPPPAERDI